MRLYVYNCNANEYITTYTVCSNDQPLFFVLYRYQQYSHEGTLQFSYRTINKR